MPSFSEPLAFNCQENPSIFPLVRIYFQLRIFRKYQGNRQKPNRILTQGPLFGSLKPLSFRTFSEMSRFYVGFTDSDSVTAWGRGTAFH